MIAVCAGMYDVNIHPQIVALGERSFLSCSRSFYKKLKNVSCEYDRVNG